MPATAPPQVTQHDLRQMIPDVMSIRQMIGVRVTELSVLRRLLKLAESHARLHQTTTTRSTHAGR